VERSRSPGRRSRPASAPERRRATAGGIPAARGGESHLPPRSPNRAQVDHHPPMPVEVGVEPILVDEREHQTVEPLLAGDARVDSVMAVSPMQPHPFKALEETGGFLRPVFPAHIDSNSQDFPTYYAPSGTFHWMRPRALQETADFWSQRRLPYVLDRNAAIDIDEPADLELARALMKHRNDPGA